MRLRARSHRRGPFVPLAMLGAVLALVGGIAIPATGAYFTDASAKTGNTATAAVLPAPTVTATAVSSSTARETRLDWTDAGAALPGLGASPVYTVQRATRADFADAVTVYEGTATSATDRIRNASAGATQVVGTEVSYGSFALIGGNVYRWGEATADNITAWGVPDNKRERTWGTPSGKLEPVTGWAAPVAKLAVGTVHACAILTTGAVQCIGEDRTVLQRANEPVPMFGPSPIDDANGVFGGRPVVDIAAGRDFTCALDGTGAVGCWGGNGWGQLGTGGRDASSVPVRIDPAVFGGRTPVLIAAAEHTACVVARGASASDTTVSCWGRNAFGQLGVPAGADGLVPAAVADPAGVLQGVTAIAAGHGVFCVLNSRTTSTNAACWGGGERGVLGDGIVHRRATPAPIESSRTGFTAIDVNGTHACAASATAVTCWGENRYGQLGTGATSAAGAISRPVDVVDRAGVLGSSPVVSLGLTWYSTCAATAAGVLACWGDGTRYQLAQGEAAGGAVALAAASSPVVVRLDGATSPSRPAGALGTADLLYRITYTVPGITRWVGATATAVRHG